MFKASSRPVGFQHLFTHHGRDSVTWKEAFIIFQHFQIKPFHPSVGGIDQPGVNQPIPNGVIDQPGPSVVFAGDRAASGRLAEGASFRRCARQIPDRGRASSCGQDRSAGPVRFCHHLRDGGDIFRLGAFALHRERVSIVHVSRFEPYQAQLRIQAFYRVVGFLWTHALIDTVENNQRCTGVFPVISICLFTIALREITAAILVCG